MRLTFLELNAKGSKKIWEEAVNILKVTKLSSNHHKSGYNGPFDNDNHGDERM